MNQENETQELSRLRMYRTIDKRLQALEDALEGEPMAQEISRQCRLEVRRLRRDEGL